MHLLCIKRYSLHGANTCHQNHQSICTVVQAFAFYLVLFNPRNKHLFLSQIHSRIIMVKPNPPVSTVVCFPVKEGCSPDGHESLLAEYRPIFGFRGGFWAWETPVDGVIDKTKLFWLLSVFTEFHPHGQTVTT